jgi:hypothetical protein
MRKITFFKAMLAAVMLLVGSLGIFAQYTGTGTFKKITSAAEVTNGYYVVVNSTDAFAMNNVHNGTYLDKTDVTPASGVISNPAATIVWKIETNGSGYTIYNEASAKYVSYTGSSNNVQIVDAVTADNQRWSVSYASDVFTITNLAVTARMLQYNAGSPRFACYTTAQQKLLLYKMETVAPNTVEIPLISVQGIEKTPGVYYNTASVSMTSGTAGASIYYTTNGAEPTTASTLYSGAFNVTANSTVKAIAVKSGMNNSAVVQKVISITTPAVGTLPFEELFTSSLGDFYAFSKTGDQVWGAASYSTGTYTKFAKMSGYSGTNKDNEDWLITPKFTASAALGLQLSFASATGFAGNALQLKYSTNYSGFGDPSTATWTDITSQATWPAENSSYAWVESGNIVIAGTMPVHFAFVYTSTTTAAATWEVANVKVINVPAGPTITVTEVSVPAMQAVVGASSTSTIHVSGVNLTTNVSLAVSGKNANRFSVSPASLTQTGGVVENTEVTITYTPAAEVADTATLTLSSTGANSVVFELTGKGIILTGAGTTENPFTVADVKKLNNSLASTTKYWVRGYIVGVPSAGNSAGNLTTVDLEAPFTGKTAIALAEADTETDLTKMIGVQLPTGAIRDALNLEDKPENFKKQVKVFGTLEAYFTAAPGVKNTAEYMFLETSLPKVDAKEFKVYAAAGQLHVEALERGEVVVFDVIGKQIYKGYLQAGHNAINLPHRGVMVVKINNRTAKVVM